MGRKGIEIDGQKLRQVIKHKGLSSTDISRELGHSDHYIANSYTSNMLSQTAMQYIERKYGISRMSISKFPIELEEGIPHRSKDGVIDCSIPNFDHEKIERIITLLLSIDDRLDDIQHRVFERKSFIVEQV